MKKGFDTGLLRLASIGILKKKSDEALLNLR